MNWISSTKKEKWTVSESFSNEKGCELVIGEKQGEAIFGWGCCISEICAKAVFSLGEEDQKTVFDQLFSEDGCGFDYCRLSIGANDFAESWYQQKEKDA